MRRLYFYLFYTLSNDIKIFRRLRTLSKTTKSR